MGGLSNKRPDFVFKVMDRTVKIHTNDMEKIQMYLSLFPSYYMDLLIRIRLWDTLSYSRRLHRYCSSNSIKFLGGYNVVINLPLQKVIKNVYF